MFAVRMDEAPESSVEVLGVRFVRYTKEQVVEQVLGWIADKSRRMVITAGPEFVMMTQRDDEVATIARRADLVTPDGIGIVLAARWCRQPVPERVTGVELGLSLLQTACQRHQGMRVFILGAATDSLNKCLERFRQEYPLCQFEGRNGYFTEADLPEIKHQISAFHPDVWLVGLGQPRQERLIYHTLYELPPCVAIGIGGSVDAWSGTVKRAPQVFQKLNLEWLYRLVKQPTRWRRQLALPRFAWQVLRKTGQRP